MSLVSSVETEHQVMESCCMCIVSLRGLAKLTRIQETEITVEVGGVDPGLMGGGGGIEKSSKNCLTLQSP